MKFKVGDKFLFSEELHEEKKKCKFWSGHWNSRVGQTIEIERIDTSDASHPGYSIKNGMVLEIEMVDKFFNSLGTMQKLNEGDTFIVTREIAEAKKNQGHCTMSIDEYIGRKVTVDYVTSGCGGKKEYLIEGNRYLEVKVLDNLLNLTHINMSENTPPLSTLAEKHMSKGQKKLYKAGFIHSDYSRAANGTEALADLLFLEKEEELVKLAEVVLGKDKEEKK